MKGPLSIIAVQGKTRWGDLEYAAKQGRRGASSIIQHGVLVDFYGLGYRELENR